jgi:hypothetical protein
VFLGKVIYTYRYWITAMTLGGGMILVLELRALHWTDMPPALSLWLV